MKDKNYLYTAFLLSISFPLIEIILYPNGLFFLSILFKINQFSILPCIAFVKKIRIPLKSRLFLYYCICLIIVALNIEVFDPKNTVLRVLSVVVPLLAMIIGWSVSLSLIRSVFARLYRTRTQLFLISCSAVAIYWFRSNFPALLPIPNAIHSSLWLTLGLELSGKISLPFFISISILTLGFELISLKRTAFIMTLSVMLASLNNVTKLKIIFNRFQHFKVTISQLILPLLMALVLSLFLLAQSTFGGRLISTYNALTQISSISGDIYLSKLTSGRSSEIDEYMSILKENPMYAWKGVPTHKLITLCNYDDECDSRYYLHNNFFSLSYQFGFPMALLIYSELILITFNAFRRTRSSQFQSILAMICLATMVNSLASSVFTLYTLPFFLFIITQKTYLSMDNN